MCPHDRVGRQRCQIRRRQKPFLHLAFFLCLRYHTCTTYPCHKARALIEGLGLWALLVGSRRRMRVRGNTQSYTARGAPEMYWIAVIVPPVAVFLSTERLRTRIVSVALTLLWVVGLMMALQVGSGSESEELQPAQVVGLALMLPNVIHAVLTVRESKRGENDDNRTD